MRLEGRGEVTGKTEAIDKATPYADKPFAREVETRIAAWLDTEAEVKARLRMTAIAEKWTAQVLAEHLRQATLTPDTLARALGMSETTLRDRLLMDDISFTAGDMIQLGRLQLAADHLVKRLASTPIIDIAQDCGWDDPRRFSICFKALWGVTPKEFQKRRLSVEADGIRQRTHNGRENT